MKLEFYTKTRNWQNFKKLVKTTISLLNLLRRKNINSKNKNSKKKIGKDKQESSGKLRFILQTRFK